MEITTPDGRTLEYAVAGPENGMPLVVHHGTPSGAVLSPVVVAAAAARGWRVVLPARPGYRQSTPRPGRTVADVASDVARLLDALGADEFVTVGWSGGGPHALAAAALLPGRCRGAATVAGVGPYGVEGLDWTAGMDGSNVEEFGAARAGAETVTKHLEKEVAGADESIRAAMSACLPGWRDDDIAFTADWGFRLDGLRVPVSVWHGDDDRMVPIAHGRWLAEHIAGARAHLLPGEGHLSPEGGHIDQILAGLR